MPKTPRAGLKGVAQSTGHVDSPETIVIGKRRSVGKRQSVSKRRSMVKRQSLIKAAESSLVQDDLINDLPPTPTAPTLMFVSPMSGEKKRKSVLTSTSTTR